MVNPFFTTTIWGIFLSFFPTTQQANLQFGEVKSQFIKHRFIDRQVNIFETSPDFFWVGGEGVAIFF